MLALPVSFLIIAALYAGLICLIGNGWKKHPVFCPTGGEEPVSLSVVIPFRNEARALPRCLESIGNQNLPQQRYEVILADDHSTDGSGEFARNFCERHEGFRYCPPDDERKGKKAALSRGIRMAVHEVIVLTDADCVAGDRWLEMISAFFASGRPDMAVGLVDLDGEGGWMHTFQEMEFLSLTGIAAGAAVLGRPLYCSSANLAFTKSLYERYPDPFRRQVASGDDTFFLHQVKSDGTNDIQLLKSRYATVTTRGQNSLPRFLQQRMRWSAKSIRYKDTDTIATAMLTMLMNLALVASLVMMGSGKYCWLFPVLFLVKTVVDLAFMKDIMVFFGKRTPFLKFVLYEFIYMAYLTIVVPAGFLARQKWKS